MTPANTQLILALLFFLCHTQSTGWRRDWLLGNAAGSYIAYIYLTIISFCH
jgi:hypothetical protein